MAAGSNGSRTPHVDDSDEPPVSPTLSKDRHETYRKCVGHGEHMGIDRYDCQGPLAKLGRGLAAPTEWNWRRVAKFRRYLTFSGDIGVWLPKVGPGIYRRRIILLRGYSDTDHAGDRVTGRSVSSKVCFADGCQLFSQVRRQSVVSIS